MLASMSLPPSAVLLGRPHLQDALGPSQTCVTIEVRKRGIHMDKSRIRILLIAYPHEQQLIPDLMAIRIAQRQIIEDDAIFPDALPVQASCAKRVCGRHQQVPLQIPTAGWPGGQAASARLRLRGAVASSRTPGSGRNGGVRMTDEQSFQITSQFG